MHLSKESVNSYIEFFVRNIIGFEKEEIKFTHIAESSDEYLLIAMDRIARLERQGGRLRQRVWNNVFFIFHENQFLQNDARKEKISDVKRIHPHLFIRSYVYFVFIDATRLSGGTLRIDTSDFKIWLFNSKYEIREVSIRQNLFNLVLRESEKIDDLMYIANTELELKRLESANSDAIDCVRAFTSELPLLEQTVNMFNKVTEELDNNENAHIIVEGPARSGKTIIAASLLGKYPNSKFLLMNAFFYQAIVDGFYALSSFSSEEIDALVRNPELDMLLILQKEISSKLKSVVTSLDSIIIGKDKTNELSRHKEKLIETIDYVINLYQQCKIDYKEHSLINQIYLLKKDILEKHDSEFFDEDNLRKLNHISSIIKNAYNGKYQQLIELRGLIPDSLKSIVRSLDIIVNSGSDWNDLKKALNSFIVEIEMISKKINKLEEYSLLVYLNEFKEQLKSTDLSIIKDKDFDRERIIKVKESIKKILNGDYNKILSYEKIIAKSINVVIENSKQRFFHHNISRDLPKQIVDGCWIIYGNPTKSRMWGEQISPKLIICDEVQRLGMIGSFLGNSSFDEIGELLNHSRQTFFTGDSCQMLNYKYDKGIAEINEKINAMNMQLSRYKLPESVGVPAEIGLLMKYLSKLPNVNLEEIVESWNEERVFKIIIIEQNQNRLVELFDNDNSNKKHFASPIDTKWLNKVKNQNIETKYRTRKEIPSLITKGKSFAYTFPYFCNEEIMPNYYLSAYELISRELDSLYVNIPKFEPSMDEDDEKWYKNHLYVLFSRPTSTLIVNFQDRDEYKKIKNNVRTILEKGVELPIIFMPKLIIKSIKHHRKIMFKTQIEF